MRDGKFRGKRLDNRKWEDGETDIRNEFRKATVEEIIKHFKKS